MATIATLPCILNTERQNAAELVLARDSKSACLSLCIYDAENRRQSLAQVDLRCDSRICAPETLEAFLELHAALAEGATIGWTAPLGPVPESLVVLAGVEADGFLALHKRRDASYCLRLGKARNIGDDVGRVGVVIIPSAVANVPNGFWLYLAAAMQRDAEKQKRHGCTETYKKVLQEMQAFDTPWSLGFTGHVV